MDMGLGEQATRELEVTASALEQAIDNAVDASERKTLITNLADARNTMAVLLIEDDRPAEGIAVMQQVIELLREISEKPDQDWRIGNTLNTLAEAKLSIGDMEGAEADLLRSMKIKRRGGSPRLIANGQAMMSRLRLRQNRFADAIEMAQLAHEERAARLQPSSRAVTSLQEIMAEALMGLERRAEARRIMEDLERVYDIDGDAMDRLAMTRLEAMLRFHEGDAGNARLVLQDAWSEIESLDRARSSVGQAIRRNLDMIEAADEHHENKLP